MVCCSILCWSLSAQAQTSPTWTSVRRLGTSIISPRAMAVDAAGNSYEVGTFINAISIAGTSLTSKGDQDSYLAKYTPTGDLAWLRQIGAADHDEIMDVALDAAGNVYVAGGFYQTVALGNNVVLDGGAGPSYNRKAFVVRYSPQGTPEWAQQSSRATNNNYGVACSVATDAEGHVYVVGMFDNTLRLGSLTITNPGTNSSNFFTCLSAATGQVQALQLAGSYVPFSSGGYYSPQVAAGPTGGAYLLLNFSQQPVFGATTLTSRWGSDGVVVKYSPQGMQLWLQQFGGTGEDRIRDGAVDAAGNVFVTGYFTEPISFDTRTLTSRGSYDGFLAKYSPLGLLQWIQAGGGPGQDYFMSVAVDATGNAYVTGSFTEVAQYGSATLTTTGYRDVSVLAYSPQGAIRWAQQAGGAWVDSGNFVGVDGRGDVYVHGSCGPSCTFGSLAPSTGLDYESFLARLTDQVLTTRTSTLARLAAYPNPATSHVKLAGLADGSQVQVVDAVGRVARTALVSSAGMVLLAGLRPGVYTLRSTDAQGRTYTSRLVVQ